MPLWHIQGEKVSFKVGRSNVPMKSSKSHWSSWTQALWSGVTHASSISPMEGVESEGDRRMGE